MIGLPSFCLQKCFVTRFNPEYYAIHMELLMQTPGRVWGFREGRAFKKYTVNTCKTDVHFKLFFILNLYFVPPTELAL